MTQHTALLELPDRLRAVGLAVVAMNGWDTAQGNYKWTTPSGAQSYTNPPSGFMVHHTGTTTTTPVVQTSDGTWSKANGWLGLERGGKLYSSGSGVPTLYLTASGPARVSSGYGYRPVLWDYVFEDLRAPWSAQGSDGSTAANRYMFNLETTHPGDYSALAPGVWDYIVRLGVVLHDMFGWQERTIGHQSWTRRKIDPRWDGRDDCIIPIQDAIQTELAGGGTGMWCNDWTDKSWMTFFDDTNIPDVNGNGRYYCSNDGTYQFNPAFGTQPDDGGAAYEEKIHAINYVFSGLAVAVGG